MRIVTVLSTVMLAALATATSTARASRHSPADADRAAIQALEDTYIQGFSARDVDQVMSVYLPGKQLFVFDVVPREYQGSDAYRKHWQELFAMFSGPIRNSISEQTIHVVGSVAHGHNIQSGEFTDKDGHVISMVVRTTDIYRKIHGKWLIVEEHNSVPVALGSMQPDTKSEP
jgi:ketosteroid isomerase-like protein